jgi:hypothetical protein
MRELLRSTDHKWRIGNVPAARPYFVRCTIALSLLSLMASVVTVTARGKLWLGPQTLVLGCVGLFVGILITFFAWQLSHASDAELFDRSWLRPSATIGVVTACVIVPVAITWFAFATFPNSADEYGFLFQAETFRHGRLWNHPPVDPGLFAQNYIVAKNGIWVSQYLPGWPAILTMLEIVHLPPWLAAPLCGAMLLLLLRAALRVERTFPALAVALLLAYASSGFFLLNSATYFSHCASALTVVGSIICMLSAERDPSWRWPAATGALLGFALLCRIDSALLVAVAAFIAWIEQGCRRRTLLFGVAGAMPLLLVFAAYNWLITGNPLMVPTAWAGNVGIGIHGLQGVENQPEHFRMLVQTFWRLGELADTASLVLPALYLAALIMRARDRKLRFYDAVPIANFALFLIFPDLGGFQMGPRYWFDGFVVMHITVGSAFSQTPIPWRRFAVVCCLLLIPISLARLPGQIAFEARVMRERSSVFRLAAALPSDKRTTILVNDFPSAWNERFNRTQPNFAKDFARNGTDLDKPILFARGDVPDALGRACAQYPDATLLSFHLDRAHPDGWLEPLACPGTAH